MPIMPSLNARHLVPAILITGLAALSGTPPAHAAPPKSATAAGYAQALTQADGITDRIIDGLLIKTDRYFHDGDYNRTIGTLRIVVEGDPNYNDGYENMAYLLWSQGHTATADSVLQYGLARTKDKGGLNFEFGRHLYTTKRYSEAEKYLAQAISLPRPQPMYYSTLAHCYEQNGKMPQAVATWRALVQKFPDFPSGPPNLRRALAKQSMPQ